MDNDSLTFITSIPLQRPSHNDCVVAVTMSDVYPVLQRGADVNATDKSGQTALHWSAVRGAAQVAEVLLNSGAQLEKADCHGYRVSPVTGTAATQHGLHYLSTV